jgi:uncharacterized damage-inducible protein DinB
MDTGTLFLDRSSHFLKNDFYPKIEGCVRQMSEEDIWWRPNEASNSVGNLVLHLAGNAKQWIVSGVGGTPDDRQRQAEFDARDAIPADELLDRLYSVIRDTTAVIGQLSPAVLQETRSIQGRTVTVLEAIYHVVEHFSMHTGQIAYIAKLRTGRDLGFYELKDGIPWPTWKKPVQ